MTWEPLVLSLEVATLSMVVALVGWIAAIALPGRTRAPRVRSAAMALGALALGLPLIARPVHAQDWYTFNGDLKADKYATADQITPDNVGKLAVAWQLHTGDVSDGSNPNGPKASDWGATPLFVNNTLYVSTPFDRIFAVEPEHSHRSPGVAPFQHARVRARQQRFRLEQRAATLVVPRGPTLDDSVRAHTTLAAASRPGKKTQAEDLRLRPRCPSGTRRTAPEPRQGQGVS